MFFCLFGFYSTATTMKDNCGKRNETTSAYPWSVPQVTPSFGPSTEAEATVWRTKCQDLNGTSATTCQFSLASATQTPSLISKYLYDKSWKAFQLINRLRDEFHVLFRCHESDGVRPPKRALLLVTTMTMPARTPNQLIHPPAVALEYIHLFPA